MINLKDLRERYEDDVEAIEADLFVIGGGNGNLIVDTMHDKPGNITELSVTSFGEGYSYEQLIQDLANRRSGFTSFDSVTTKGMLYGHYSPLDIGGWQLLLTQPESVVFKSARQTGHYFMIIATLITFVMVLYIMIILIAQRKSLNTSKNSSDIRKCLLSLNQQFDRIYDALRDIAKFAKADASFVVDSYGVDYTYVTQKRNPKEFTGEEKAYIVSKIMAYVTKKRKEFSNEVYMSRIIANKNLAKTMPDLYEFMKRKGIKTIYFACVSNNNASFSLLGVINPKNKDAYELLTDIAICFTMAIYNKKYLVKTETAAHTDALTGVANRMAYKEYVKNMSASDLEKFVCIYIDVNELNHYNNEYGHAAGDQMLVFIAETLKNEFKDSYIFRMGGDEFLIFTEKLLSNGVEEKIQNANKKIEEMKYHISIGIKYGNAELTVEELMNSAEKLMYAQKAKYYQNKEAKVISNFTHRTMEAEVSGIKEIDAYLSAMGQRFLGVYCVMHESDTALSVLSPSYFSELLKISDKFSVAFKKYIFDVVKPEHHRKLLNFLDYGMLQTQLKEGINPSITYDKIDGEKVTLSIYMNTEEAYDDIDTVWVFEKEGKTIKA